MPEGAVSKKGRDMIAELDAARERLTNRILVDSTDDDLDQLQGLNDDAPLLNGRRRVSGRTAMR